MRDLIAGTAIALCLSITPFPAAAQTLVEAYRAALETDPDHASAQADRDTAEEGEGIGRSLFRPKARVQAGVGYSRITTGGADTGLLPGTVDGASANALVLAQQPIIDGDAAAQRRQLRAGARAGRAQYDAARQQLALRVVQAYFDILRAENMRVAIAAQEASARREQRGAQARFDAGRAQITDVREAQAQGDGAAAQLVVADTQLALATSRFRALTGIDPVRLGRPSPGLIPVPPVSTLVEAKALAVEQSPVLLARQEQLAASRANADRYRWSSQAKLSAQGVVGHFRNGGSQAPLLGIGGFPDRATVGFVGLQLDVPLYTGGGLEAQRRQADAQARSIDAGLRAAQRDVELRSEQAWLNQTAAVRRIAATRAALESARLQERAALTGREVGTRTQSDVLLAQTQTFEAERQLNDAVFDYEYSRSALAAEAGMLDDDTLAAIDRDLVR